MSTQDQMQRDIDVAIPGVAQVARRDDVDDGTYRRQLASVVATFRQDKLGANMTNAAQRIRDDLYSGRTTIRAMPFEDRVLAEENGIITGRDISFAFWDGSFPPPAEIRCHVHKHERLKPNTERVAGCMLLEGHDGECDFR